eukprot:TRINITY_DN45479_c0_g1_i1.p1 TRINITY_DN45479_c0_g1~~TRINITY_DN45479_c0_g1_i1.p1  ORF type:complete len:449 (+),score=49.16 TRINITY_DN45479_c0_g1_i1:115-1461(+)
MGVSHSMDHAQVESVLTEFEATTRSIRGIDDNMSRIGKYMGAVRSQRDSLNKTAEQLNKVIDDLGDSLAGQSEALYDFYASNIDHFADLVEALEESFFNMKLHDAPRQIQREFRPLLVPAVVLVLIVTVSNCYFGFLLASDEELTGSLLALRGIAEEQSEQTDLNILNIFAISHVVLLGVAILYVVVDIVRSCCRRRRRTKRKQEKAKRKEAVDEELRRQRELEDSAEFEAGRGMVIASQAQSESFGFETSNQANDEPSDEAGNSPHSRPSSKSSSRAPSPLSLHWLKWDETAAGTIPSQANETSPSHKPLSQMLRRLKAATDPEGTPISPATPEKIRQKLWRHSKENESLASEWIGGFFVQTSKLEIHIAAVASAQVVKCLHRGASVHVLHAIRGGHGKIWGRIEKPHGWIVLVDPQLNTTSVSRQPLRDREAKSSGQSSSSRILSF